MRILAFGAHPDDVEFRCAGTLAKYAKRGDEVFICIATNGEIGSYGMTREQIAAMRKKEAEASCALIGAHLIWLGYEDEMLFDERNTRMASSTGGDNQGSLTAVRKVWKNRLCHRNAQ